MAAEVHLLRGGEIADVEGVLPRPADKGGLRVLQLPGQGPHEPLLREIRLPQQGHAGLIAGEAPGGKGVRYKQFHIQFPHC